MKKNDNISCPHKTSIGGQAVIEGVMMRGPKKIATAVRKSSGEIVMDIKPVNSFVARHKLHKIPLLRGVLSFVESMVTGIKCLMFSADQVDLEDGEKEEMSKFEKWLDDKLGDKIKDIAIYFSVVVAMCFSIGLFMLLPTAIAGIFKSLVKSSVALNLIEGLIKMTIFLVYLWAVSKMSDIKRVFAYHGAEHKAIFCFEHGNELTVENIRKELRYHPRCGTAFIFVTILLSIIVSSVVPNTITSALGKVFFKISDIINPTFPKIIFLFLHFF